MTACKSPQANSRKLLRENDTRHSVIILQSAWLIFLEENVLLSKQRQFYKQAEAEHKPLTAVF